MPLSEKARRNTMQSNAVRHDHERWRLEWKYEDVSHAHVISLDQSIFISHVLDIIIYNVNPVKNVTFISKIEKVPRDIRRA